MWDWRCSCCCVRDRKHGLCFCWVVFWRSQRVWFCHYGELDIPVLKAADRLLSSGKGCAAGAPRPGGRPDKEMKTKRAAFTELTVNLNYKQTLKRDVGYSSYQDMELSVTLSFYEHPCYTNHLTFIQMTEGEHLMVPLLAVRIAGERVLWSALRGTVQRRRLLEKINAPAFATGRPEDNTTD